MTSLRDQSSAKLERLVARARAEEARGINGGPAAAEVSRFLKASSDRFDRTLCEQNRAIKGRIEGVYRTWRHRLPGFFAAIRSTRSRWGKPTSASLGPAILFGSLAFLLVSSFVWSGVYHSPARWARQLAQPSKLEPYLFNQSKAQEIPNSIERAHSGVRRNPAQPKRRVAGRVVDEDGFGIQGARIEAFQSFRPVSLGEQLSELSRRHESLFDTTSQADGLFALQVPNLLPVVLRASAPGFAVVEAPLLHRGATTIRLGRGFRASLKILGSDGEALSGAELELLPATTSPSFGDLRVPGRTNAFGVMTCSNLSRGKWRVVLRRKGAGPVVWEDALCIPSKSQAVLRLPPSHVTISGSVRSEEGVGIPRARVIYIAWFEGGFTFFVSYTDESGSFLERDVVASDTRSLYVSRPGYVPTCLAAELDEVRRNSEEQAQSQCHIDVRLCSGLVLCGQLIDKESGQPIKGGRVRIFDGVGVFAVAGSTTTSDARGKFQISGLRHDEYALEIQARGYDCPQLPGVFKSTETWGSHFGPLFFSLDEASSSRCRVFELSRVKMATNLGVEPRKRPPLFYLGPDGGREKTAR